MKRRRFRRYSEKKERNRRKYNGNGEVPKKAADGLSAENEGETKFLTPEQIRQLNKAVMNKFKMR